jgi:MFS family permease
MVQGGMLRRMVKKMGEPKVIATSLFLAAAGIAVLPFLTTWATLLLALAVFSTGSSLTRPPVFGMISMLTPAHEQGSTIGVAQGIGSLARIAGPFFAIGIFGKDHLPVPYLCCAALCFATGCITTRYLSRPKSGGGE